MSPSKWMLFKLHVLRARCPLETEDLNEFLFCWCGQWMDRFCGYLALKICGTKGGHTRLIDTFYLLLLHDWGIFPGLAGSESWTKSWCLIVSSCSDQWSCTQEQFTQVDKHYTGITQPCDHLCGIQCPLGLGRYALARNRRSIPRNFKINVFLSAWVVVNPFSLSTHFKASE